MEEHGYAGLGGNTRACKHERKKQSCGDCKESPQPFFCELKDPPVHHRDLEERARLSRSPDSRIVSFRTAFSSKRSMTDFRHVRSLHAYSGGTVPGSHRIIYSLLSRYASQQHSNAIQIVCIIAPSPPFVNLIFRFFAKIFVRSDCAGTDNKRFLFMRLPDACGTGIRPAGSSYSPGFPA